MEKKISIQNCFKMTKDEYEIMNSWQSAEIEPFLETFGDFIGKK